MPVADEEQVPAQRLVVDGEEQVPTSREWRNPI
jgi:hypothetical protein